MSSVACETVIVNFPDIVLLALTVQLLLKAEVEVSSARPLVDRVSGTDDITEWP
jgi:hypothetical protein